MPMKIVKIDAKKGVAEAEGLRRDVDIQFLKDPKIGDYVVIHAGFAIEKIDEKKALETIDLYKKLRP
jgi:hydrogenase expression/formation protein HypC